MAQKNAQIYKQTEISWFGRQRNKGERDSRIFAEQQKEETTEDDERECKCTSVVVCVVPMCTLREYFHYFQYFHYFLLVDVDRFQPTGNTIDSLLERGNACDTIVMFKDWCFYFLVKKKIPPCSVPRIPAPTTTVPGTGIELFLKTFTTLDTARPRPRSPHPTPLLST